MPQDCAIQTVDEVNAVIGALGDRADQDRSVLRVETRNVFQFSGGVDTFDYAHARKQGRIRGVDNHVGDETNSDADRRNPLRVGREPDRSVAGHGRYLIGVRDHADHAIPRVGYEEIPDRIESHVSRIVETGL